MARLTIAWSETLATSHDVAPEDPLAFDHLEHHIGGMLWPGFSQRTGQATYYLMATYGLWVAERAVRRYGLPATDDSVRLLFERWERLWAMAICVHHEGRIPPEDRIRGQRGVERAYPGRKRRYPLDYTLIARQRELGALAAYLSSLRAHGFVAPQQLRLTPVGWELAQEIWDDDPVRGSPWDDFVLQALNPQNRTVGDHGAGISLADLGDRVRPSRLAERPETQRSLYHRLFEDIPPELQDAGKMAVILAEARGQGMTQTREILERVRRNRFQAECPMELRNIADFAIGFGDLAHSLRSIFDRIYQTVLAHGYQAEWGECVRAAIPEGFVAALNDHVSAWEFLDGAERVGGIPVYGEIFAHALRRINTQNPYHIFGSILNLHERVQRARGKPAGWIARDGDMVYLRHAGYERWSLAGTAWAPGYPFDTMANLIDGLGRLR